MSSAALFRIMTHLTVVEDDVERMRTVMELVARQVTALTAKRAAQAAAAAAAGGGGAAAAAVGPAGAAGAAAPAPEGA